MPGPGLPASDQRNWVSRRTSSTAPSTATEEEWHNTCQPHSSVGGIIKAQGQPGTKRRHRPLNRPPTQHQNSTTSRQHTHTGIEYRSTVPQQHHSGHQNTVHFPAAPPMSNKSTCKACQARQSFIGENTAHRITTSTIGTTRRPRGPPLHQNDSRTSAYTSLPLHEEGSLPFSS